MAIEAAYNIGQSTVEGSWEECPVTYTDESLEWASDTYSVATITANSIALNTVGVGGTDTATSDPYSAVIGEMIRVVCTVTDDGSSDLPNYAFDGDTGTLAFGVNYLEFRATSTAAKTFQINHTNGEDAVCTVVFILYSCKGL